MTKAQQQELQLLVMLDQANALSAAEVIGTQG